MNHFQRNREIAINLQILERLVQDREKVKLEVNSERFHELIHISDFYFKYFPASRFILNFPQTLQMMQRETAAAFSYLLPQTKIISKFDEEYPPSLIQDLREDAPLFIYACGNLSLLRRKAIKITIVGSRSANEKEIVQSKVLASRLAQEGYTIVSGFDNPLDTSVQMALHTIERPGIVILNQPLLKSFIADTLQESVKRNLFIPPNLLISALPPIQTPLLKTDIERTNKILASLSKVSIVMSAKEGGHAMDEATFCVKLHKPVILPDYIRLSIPFLESKYILSVKTMEELLLLVEQFT